MTLLPIVVKKDVRRPIHSGLNLVSERLTFLSIIFGLEFLEPQRFIIIDNSCCPKNMGCEVTGIIICQLTYLMQ